MDYLSKLKSENYQDIIQYFHPNREVREVEKSGGGSHTDFKSGEFMLEAKSKSAES